LQQAFGANNVDAAKDHYRKHGGEEKRNCQCDIGTVKDPLCFQHADYEMGDIGNSFDSIASASACQDKCKANADCKIFVFDPVDKMCWLKCAAGVDCEASANGATQGPLPTDRYISGTNTPQPDHCDAGAAKWGECSEDDLFGPGGEVIECGEGKAIAGLFRSSNNGVDGINKMKCCELENALVPA
jgi:hypothetical protein